VEVVQRPPLVAGSGRVVRPGLMNLSDLAEYVSYERPPITSDYRGYTVYGMDLPSSGGVTLALTLNMLQGYDLNSLSRADVLHLLIESERLAYADRAAYMGDSRYVEVPLAGLLSPDYAASRRNLITERAGANPARPGDPYAFLPSPGAGDVPGPSPSMPTITEGVSTTHITVADADGNVVAYTCTIEDIGGSGIAVPGYGFLLNNELTDFDDSPPSPNAPEGGKRPRSSMTPTLVFRDGQPVLGVGSPGGTTIITTVVQVVMNVLDFGMELPDAIAAPRFTQRNTASTSAEASFIASAEARALANRGHRFVDEGAIGAVTGIAFARDGTRVAAAESTRLGGGSALVIEGPTSP
jgi:gamma-glutamyltranspeptidase / glutathione hydrolase